jgi:hypothetical protein
MCFFSQTFPNIGQEVRLAASALANQQYVSAASEIKLDKQVDGLALGGYVVGRILKGHSWCFNLLEAAIRCVHLELRHA